MLSFLNYCWHLRMNLTSRKGYYFLLHSLDIIFPSFFTEWNTKWLNQSKRLPKFPKYVLSSESIHSGCIYIHILYVHKWQRQRFEISLWGQSFCTIFHAQWSSSAWALQWHHMLPSHSNKLIWDPSLDTPSPKPELLEIWSNSFLLTTVRFQEDKRTITLPFCSFWQYNPIEFPPL